MISYENIIEYNTSKEGAKCMVCNHYYFKNKFDYQPYVCNECHNFSLTVMDLSDFFIIIFILTINYISNINKKVAGNILNNSLLCDKGVL